MRAVEHLLRLVAIESVSAVSNRGVVAYAAGVLRAAGWGVREMGYVDGRGVEKVNVVAAPAGQDVAEMAVELAMVCHTDTVPFAAGWAGALAPVVEGGLVRGCGACDVKGFLACLLEVASGGGEFAAGLRIVLTADEEVGCVGAGELLAREPGFRARRVVVGEPTSLRVARAGKGYCLAEVVVRGLEAHSAHPAEGASAIYAAARMIGRIEGMAEELKGVKHGLFEPGYTTVNVGTIGGGTAKNVVPGECRFLVEWRPVPGLAADFVPHALRGFADEVSVGGIRCEVEVLREQMGFETAAEAGLVCAMERAAGRGVMGIPFGSEASVLAGRAEEIVVFGPGDMRTAHSERECVAVTELEEAVVVLRGLMTGARELDERMARR